MLQLDQQLQKLSTCILCHLHLVRLVSSRLTSCKYQVQVDRIDMVWVLTLMPS